MSEQKPEPVNQSGSAGSHGCACESADARWCYIVRYDIDPSDDQLDDGRCECLCHEWRDKE
jgi:hypothetical protein